MVKINILHTWVSFVCFLLLNSIKNNDKFVFLLPFMFGNIFFSYFLFSKIIFLFLRLKNLFKNPKWTENKNCFQNLIWEEN